MFKKFLAVLCAVLMTFAIGCTDKVVYEDLSNYENLPPEMESVPDFSLNPLTGESGFENTDKAKQRPIAIMINNLNDSVRKVQTGLSKADIVYETEVEGGLTRLLAVYQDISEVEKIGTVRSARYQHIDLAMGHDAVYVHYGHNVYCDSHLNDLDHIDFKKSSNGSERITNGLATEHTAYALADKLSERVTKDFNIAAKKARLWANFTNNKLTLDGGSATSVSVPFPATTTNFTYDEQTGLYTRLVGTEAQTDYFTEDKTEVKNIFVLLTDMSYFADNYTRKVDLTAGDGYYITNGTVQFIKWQKGAATDGFKFTDTNGNEIQVSVGNSWVCIANKSTCNPTIQ